MSRDVEGSFIDKLFLKVRDLESEKFVIHNEDDAAGIDSKLDAGLVGADASAHSIDQVYDATISSKYEYIIGSMTKKFAEEALLCELIDKRQEAIIIVDNSLRIMHSNAVGQKLLEAGDFLKIHDGRLFSSNRRNSLKIYKSIDMLKNSNNFKTTYSWTVLLNEDRRSLPILLTSLSSSKVGANIEGATAIIARPSPAVPMLELARGMYGLSQTETSVVRDLIMGRSVKEIATQMNVMISTVRSHLKSISSKTGASRQTEIVTTVLRLPFL